MGLIEEVHKEMKRRRNLDEKYKRLRAELALDITLLLAEEKKLRIPARVQHRTTPDMFTYADLPRIPTKEVLKDEVK